MTKFLKFLIFGLFALGSQMSFGQAGTTRTCTNVNGPHQTNDQSNTVWDANLACDITGCVAPGFTQEITSLSVTAWTLTTVAGSNFCPSWFLADVLVNGNQVLTGVCGPQVLAYDFNQHAPITSLQFRVRDNDAFNDTYVLNYTLEITTSCSAVTAPPAPTCLLVCSGDQNITLAGGQCEWQLPNLVTLAGNCDPILVPGPRVNFVTAPWEFLTYPQFNLFPWVGFPPAGNAGFTINRSTIQAGQPMMNVTGVPVAPTNTVVLRGKEGVGNYSFVTMIRLNPAPFAGTLRFDWAYETDDTNAFWDPFQIEFNTASGFLNGATTIQIANPNLANQSGSFTRAVAANDAIQILVWSRDNFGGEARATISNFVLSQPDVLLPYTIVQTGGPLTGSMLAPGTYVLSYDLVSPRGEVLESCTFTVTVTGFPNPTRSLACNDNINISADAECNVTLNADMFLEGGPYACYNDYQINIWPFNSQANAISNVPQNEAIFLPCGEHTYEIMDPVTGNKCWGKFLIEDKIAPVVDCACEDVDVITPVTSFTGSLTTASLLWNRCGGFAGFPVRYQVFPFRVSGTGSYTFNAANSNGDTYAYIYQGAFDAANPCANIIAQNDDGAGGLDPLITINLTAGVDYFYVFTEWATPTAQGAFNVAITSTAGQVLTVTNRSNAPECQFKCYELDVVKAETLGQLLNFPPDNANKSKLTAPPTFSDACGAVSADFENSVEYSQCGKSKLRRSWTITDAKGNVTYCTQTFTFDAITVFELELPERDVLLTCGLDASPAAIAAYYDVDSRPQPCSATNIGAYCDDWAQTPAVEELNEGNRYGYFTYPLPGFNIVPATAPNIHYQKVSPNVCNIYTQYTDVMVPACDLGCGGNMKIVRTWTILDWCSGGIFNYTQFIKAVDTKAPTFDVKDHVVSVDPWGCEATWPVDRPWELQDNCSKPEEITWGVTVPRNSGIIVSGVAPNITLGKLPKGTHTITYWAKDCCGNISEKVSTIRVIDASSPVAVAKQNIVLSLTGSGTAADGSAKIYGFQVDNGSYDHCTPVVRLEVRRLSGGSCGNVGGNSHNNNSTYNNHNGELSEVPGAVWFHPMDNPNDTDGGEFVKFCCEDIPAGEEFGLHDVELRVWDDGNMNAVLGDNRIIDGTKDNYNTTWVTIRVENKLPPKLVCPADVTVTCDMDINLSIGEVTKVADVNLSMTGYPTAFDLCTNLEITYTDQWIGQSNPVCKTGTIRRTFTARKGTIVVTCPQLITIQGLTVANTVTFAQNNGTTEWSSCDFTLADARNANNPLIKRPIVNYGPCDIVGENITIDTFLFEDGACKKWRVTYEYINWCTGLPIRLANLAPMVHYYAYKDEIAPVITCNDQMFAANPNPLNPQGGCEASVVLTASATDALVCADESWIKWQMFADLWANGTVDRIASSFVNRAWNGIWVTIPRFVNGAVNPAWTALQNQHPNQVLDDIVYATYVRPTAASGGTVTLPSFILPAENINHKIVWKATDGCGNHDNCESTLMVVDKKPPTPYCVSISSKLMAGTPPMVELWAVDFDKGSFDNCTPQSKLYFTFDGVAPIYARINEAHFYKAGPNGSINATQADYNNGRAYRWLPSSRSAGKVFTTPGVLSVDVDVWDEAWNTDYCTVTLTLGQSSGSIVDGNIATEAGRPVNNVGVVVDVQGYIEFPKVATTNSLGIYGLEIPGGASNYTVRPTKGGNYIDGVSTLDLVMIQRHILGVSPFTNNYQFIAADANNDGYVRASDLADLRKLILNQINELPSNESWRFVLSGSTMQVSPNVFTEVGANTLNNNFVAVKIGDVNQSATGDIDGNVVESRTNSAMVMSVTEDEIGAGSTVSIPVRVSEYEAISGFQFTLNAEGAEIVSVEPGVVDVAYAQLTDKIVTMSYASEKVETLNAGDVLFTVTVKADKAINASDVLSVSSEMTRSESYNADLQVGAVRMESRSLSTGYALSQNEPNPFKGQTSISFELPEAASATLTIMDVTGKAVATRTIGGNKGVNTVVINRSELGATSSVMFYTLESGDFKATKRMILVD